VRECSALGFSTVLQAGAEDRWIWQLHLSKMYSVSTTYQFLSAVRDVPIGNYDILWYKVVPLKVNIFVSQLLLNRIPTKNNLFRRGVTQHNDLPCTGGCDMDEDVDHLLFQCGFYGSFCLISLWLGCDSVIPSTLTNHFWYFTSIPSFSKNIREYIRVIWFNCVDYLKRKKQAYISKYRG